MAVPNTFENGQVAQAPLINENFKYVGMVPIGAVISWLKSYTNTPALDDHYVECNGQTLSDADSPFNGQVIPNLNGGSATSGTATSGADTTITQSTANWGVNAFAGFMITLTGGTGAGQFRKVLSNTATAITIEGKWTTTNPGSGTTFVVSSPKRFLMGSTTSGTTGFDMHNHKWTDGYSKTGATYKTFSLQDSTTYSFDVSGNKVAIDTDTAQNPDTLRTNYTSIDGVLPPYYEVVFIMRVK